MSIKTWIKFSAVWAVTLLTILLSVVFIPVLNGQVGDIKAAAITALSIPGLTNNPLANLSNNSAYSLLNFLLSYSSFEGIFSLPGLGLFKFWSLLLYIFLPIFTLIGGGLAIFVITLSIINNQAKWKNERLVKITLLSKRITGIITYLLLFIGLFLIAIQDNSAFNNSQKLAWYNLSADGNIVTFENGTTFHPTIFSIVGLVINQFGLNHFFSNQTAVLQAGMVILIFLTPIFFVIYLVSLIINQAVRVVTPQSLSYGGASSFSQWLGFVNISSRRELRTRLGSNIGMILLFFGFIAVMIFPTFIPLNGFQTANYVIIAIALVLIFTSFFPLYFMLYRLKNLRRFSYNLLMFIQMLVWLIIGVVWQLVLIIAFQKYFQYPAYISIITTFIFSLILVISFLLLVRGHR
ncbi:motility transmembrane protein [Spiroplasma syrphidicola EA-1]|uniref:Motility transmembrane protein n=1 Tax=Spiroplasma syrphidicola EA-1 TaxID=1276229 RepID=R4UE54_9MOLU|nr:motility-associated protein Scm1 [Spiroplasma syrphidicola]AGM26179.1 motility transmembrane protein [Spiroplasma syrphidicola EA-1]